MNPSFAKNRGMLVPRAISRWLVRACGTLVVNYVGGVDAGHGTAYRRRKEPHKALFSLDWNLSTGLYIESPTKAAKLLRKWGHTEAADAALEDK